jgi:hypothetical protein
MQLVTPNVVAMAVRMLIANCMMNFQVSFFIIKVASPQPSPKREGEGVFFEAMSF